MDTTTNDARAERLANVKATICGLKSDERHMVLMRYVDEMDDADIAEVLGVPVAVVSDRLNAIVVWADEAVNGKRAA